MTTDDKLQELFEHELQQPLTETVTNLNDLKEPYKLLELSDLIIKEMNLNTRIWTKQ